MLRALLAFMLALSLVSAPAHADSRQELEEVQQRIAELEAQASASKEQRTEQLRIVLDAAADVDRLRSEVAIAEAALADADLAIAAVTRRMDQLEGDIADVTARILALTDRIERDEAGARSRVADMYMAGQVRPTVDPLAMSDVASLSVGMAYAGRLETKMREDLDNLVAARQVRRSEARTLLDLKVELDASRAELERVRSVRSDAVDGLTAASEAANSAFERQTELLEQLEHDIEHFEGEIVVLAREEDAIRETIRREEAAAAAAAAAQASQASSAQTTAVPTTSSSGFARPVPGAVSSGYGYRIHPITGDRRLHTGWDMNGSCGSPIRSAKSGRVILADWKGGYGKTTMIDHGGGVVTLYAHQSEWVAPYGSWVEAGQIIGKVGTTGQSTGCHLHYEIRIGGDPVDPARYH